MTTRVVVIDDELLVREALCELVRTEPGFEIAGGFADVASAEGQLDGVDLVIAELGLPRGGTLDLVSRLHGTRTRTIVVAAHDRVSDVRAALAAGADGFVCKTADARVLFDAIRHAIAHDASPPLPELSERERAVLVELASGRTYKDIGIALGIGPRTVETYRRRVGEKLGLRTRSDLVRYAIEMRLLG